MARIRRVGLEAAESRHLQVHQDGVEGYAGGQADCGLAVVGDQGGDAAPRQRRREQSLVDLVVLDDEDTRGAGQRGRRIDAVKRRDSGQEGGHRGCHLPPVGACRQDGVGHRGPAAGQADHDDGGAAPVGGGAQAGEERVRRQAGHVGAHHHRIERAAARGHPLGMADGQEAVLRRLDGEADARQVAGQPAGLCRLEAGDQGGAAGVDRRLPVGPRALGGKFKRELAAHAHGAVQRQRPAHQGGVLATQRQPQTEPFAAVRGVATAAPEPLEDDGTVLAGNARAGVGHREADRRAAIGIGDGGGANLHRAGGGELDGVARQVEQHLAQPGRIDHPVAMHRIVEAGPDLQPLVVRLRRQHAGHLVHQCRHIDLGGPQLGIAGAAGDLQHAVQQRQQRLGTGLDPADPDPLLVAEIGFLEQQGADAEDAVHRRADIVADGGEHPVAIVEDRRQLLAERGGLGLRRLGACARRRIAREGGVVAPAAGGERHEQQAEGQTATEDERGSGGGRVAPGGADGGLGGKRGLHRGVDGGDFGRGGQRRRPPGQPVDGQQQAGQQVGPCRGARRRLGGRAVDAQAVRAVLHHEAGGDRRRQPGRPGQRADVVQADNGADQAGGPSGLVGDVAGEHESRPGPQPGGLDPLQRQGPAGLGGGLLKPFRLPDLGLAGGERDGGGEHLARPVHQEGGAGEGQRALQPDLPGGHGQPVGRGEVGDASGVGQFGEAGERRIDRRRQRLCGHRQMPRRLLLGRAGGAGEPPAGSGEHRRGGDHGDRAAPDAPVPCRLGTRANEHALPA